MSQRFNLDSNCINCMMDLMWYVLDRLLLEQVLNVYGVHWQLCYGTGELFLQSLIL